MVNYGCEDGDGCAIGSWSYHVEEVGMLWKELITFCCFLFFCLAF